MNMNQKSLFTFIFVLQTIFSLAAMQDSLLTKRQLPLEAAETTQTKIPASAIAQLEHKMHSEKVTLPLTAIVEAHLASNTREECATQLLEYLANPSVYFKKNPTRHALACKWIKNATSRIFPQTNQLFTELIINACDASLDPIYATGKNGIGFFSIFNLLLLPPEKRPTIVLETTYRDTHNQLKSYSITFQAPLTPDVHHEIIAIFDFSLQSKNTETGTTIRIKSGQKNLSKKACESIQKQIRNSLRFYEHFSIFSIMQQNPSSKQIALINTNLQINKKVSILISPESIIIQDSGTGISLWNALQHLLVPSSTNKNRINTHKQNGITAPVITPSLDTDKATSHFFMTVNGITIVHKKLPNAILDQSGQSFDLHIPLPSQTQTTLARNEIIIRPDGTSSEEAYLKNMISLAIDKTIDGSIGNQQILYALYQGLEQWEQESAQTHIQGLFSRFLQDELNKKLQSKKAYACPLEFFKLYDRHFNTNAAHIIPVHPSLVFNNYEPLEQHLKKLGNSRLATPTKNQKKALQNKAAGGGLIFGMNVFFLPNIPEISQYGLRSCIFAPEKEFFKNNTIPHEQDLINQLILALPEKHHRQTNLVQAHDTIHLTPEQQHLYNCFVQQYEPLFKRFNINPQALVNPLNFSYSWIENFTRSLDPLIPNRQNLTTKMLQDSFSLNMLTLITKTFQALPFLNDAFKTLHGTLNGSYQQLFSFSSSNLPFCYGNISTHIEPYINNHNPANTVGTIASLIHTLTQSWNQSNKEYLEKIMYLQMQDFAQKTANIYRDQALAQLQLYVPSGIHGTPLHLLGLLAGKLEYSPEVINLIKTIVSNIQTPEQLALILVTLISLDLSLIHYACSPHGLKSLTTIIQHYVQKKVDVLAMKKIYCSLHFMDCNNFSTLQELSYNEPLCTTIKTMLEKSINRNNHIETTHSTLPKELSGTQIITSDRSFFLSQLFKTHCQEPSFAEILKLENLDEIIGLIEKFHQGKLNKIEQYIAGSEKNPIEESILECLQNSTDATREFYHNSSNMIDVNEANILTTIEMEINSLQKTNTHQSLQFTIHDQAGFPSLKTLLTHFVLPDLSDKSDSNGSVGEMGNGSFKMYQKADIVQVLTRTTNNQSICYLLTIEPQRSPQSGLVEDLKLTCRNVSSITPKTFRGTSICITFQEEPFQVAQITAGQIADFLHHCIGSTTAQLDKQIPFNIVLHENNKQLHLNRDSSRTLIHQRVNDKNEVIIKIFKRPHENLQSIVSTAGIPFCPFDIFAREQNLLPENFIRQLEKGYIIDFQLGTYKPVQSRTKIQSTISKKELRTIFLDLFYIHGLNQTTEEKNLLQQRKISLHQSRFISRFTHFASQCNIFQLIPSQLDEQQFNRDIQNYLESGIWQTNLLEAKFFDFYHFEAGAHKSFSRYLHEIKKIIEKKRASFHVNMIDSLKQSNQDLLNSIASAQDHSTIKNELRNNIKKNLEARKSQLNVEWFTLHSMAIEFWKIDILGTLTKEYDNAVRGVFIDIIVPWIMNKMDPKMYQFDTDFYAEYYLKRIMSHSTTKTPSKKQATSTQPTQTAALIQFFEHIQTRFCQDFLDSINTVKTTKPISCAIVKSLAHNTLGNFNSNDNTIKLNALDIDFLSMIQFIQFIEKFDTQAMPIQQIHDNHFFNSFYWPCIGNIPTLIHELEHARRACYLQQYPGSSGCESHNDGYDVKNNFVNFEACAHSWAEEAFKNGLLIKLIAVIQEAMKNNPALSDKINDIASNPDSEENKRILQDLGGCPYLMHASSATHQAMPLPQTQQTSDDLLKMFRLHNVTSALDLSAFLTIHNINDQDEDGCTVLHYAVKDSNYQLAEVILKFGANSNIQNKDGDTALHLAYKKKKYEIPHDIINLLIFNGACLTINNNDGDTPLHCGIKNNAEIGAEILKNLSPLNIFNTQNGKTILNEALSQPLFENTLLIEQLLDLDADISSQDIEGNLPIHYAAKYRRISILEKILNKNPELINAQNRKGQTSLFFAIESQSIDKIELLLNKGADKNLKDYQQNNIMHQLLSIRPFPTCAFIKNVIKKIEANTAKQLLNDQNIHGELPIHMISGDIPTTTLKFLIPKVSNLAAQDKNGSTLLHKILIDTKSVNQTTVKKNIEYLLSLNPKKMPPNILTLRNGHGFTLYQCTQDQEIKKMLQAKQPGATLIDNDITETPLHWAIKNNLTKYVEVHLRDGNYSPTDMHNGMTALHLACYHGYLEIIPKLIEAGSKLDERDAYGNTPLHWAVLGGQTSAVKDLLTRNPALYHIKDNFGNLPVDLTKNQILINALEKLKPQTNFSEIKHLI